MFLPTSQGLFVFFRWLKHLFPGVKENRLNSEMESTAPTVTPGWTTTHYPSPLWMAALRIRRFAQVSCAAGAEGHSRNHSCLHAPCHNSWQTALPGAVGGLLGKAADMVDEQSQKTRRAPPELLFIAPVLLQNGNGRFLFLPFFACYKTFFVL